jgi:hypothetical protein
MIGRGSAIVGIVGSLALFAGLSLAAGLGLEAPGTRYADMPGQKSAGSVDVDVELVLAVDISYSMDYDELALQREGYMDAITSPEFIHAIRNGMHGKVAITYVEWAGIADQKTVVSWRLVDGIASAQALAAEIGRAPVRRAYRTSISGALMYSASLFESNGYRGIRRVIDVSGDGANNGLPIMLKRPNYATMDLDNLDIYYEDCVIGGAGAFVVSVRERDKFKEAIRTKLVLEIAAREPPARIIPAAADAPRVRCTIGEELWQQRWGNGLDNR